MKKRETHSESSDSSDDEVAEIQVRKVNKFAPRSSVSAEVFGKHNRKEDFKARNIPKSSDVKKKIANRLSQAFMFQALDDLEKEIVINAMEEKLFKAGDQVINQGEEGDLLYVIESGSLDCYKKYHDKPEPVYLKTYEPGEFFGELALLYNAPRAASIKAKTDCQTWALDRATFNNIVKDSAMRKREKYEKFLLEWSLLKEIDDPYEKTKIADALINKNYQKDTVVLQQGAKDNDIYIVETGEVAALDSKKQVIFKYGKADYFGEVQILFGKNQPFSFVVVSDSAMLLRLPASSYRTTLKLVEPKLKKLAEKYAKFL